PRAGGGTRLPRDPLSESHAAGLDAAPGRIHRGVHGDDRGLDAFAILSSPVPRPPGGGHGVEPSAPTRRAGAAGGAPPGSADRRGAPEARRASAMAKQLPGGEGRLQGRGAHRAGEPGGARKAEKSPLGQMIRHTGDRVVSVTPADKL